MAADKTFKATTEFMNTVGANILTDTATLDAQTTTLLGQIDDTCKLLPGIVYQSLESGFISWKAILGRSDEERTRLGKVLQATAKAIEQNEQKIKGPFTPPNGKK
jgi:hypothetical protein